MKKQQWFVINRIHRDDLKALGFKNTAKISDKIMQEIADKLNDDVGWGDNYTTALFEIAQDFNIKLK